MGHVLTWNRQRMANGEDHPRKPTQGFVDISVSYLPTLKAIGVCAAVAAVSWWASDLSNNVEQTKVAVVEVQTSLAKDRAEQTEQVKSLEKDLNDLETEVRLLRDYTEGRIGHLPYRPISNISPSGDPR